MKKRKVKTKAKPKIPACGNQHLHPSMPLPLNHVVECPTNWLADPNLKPVDVVTLLVMLAHATDKLEVQISRKQLGRIIGIRFVTAASAIKRLVKHGYLERLPYTNGFAPKFRVTPKIGEVKENSKKVKSKKSNVLKGMGLSAEAGGGQKRDRGVAPGGHDVKSL